MWHSIGCLVVGVMVGAAVVYVWFAVMFTDRNDDGWPR